AVTNRLRQRRGRFVALVARDVGAVVGGIAAGVGGVAAVGLVDPGVSRSRTVGAAHPPRATTRLAALLVVVVGRLRVLAGRGVLALFTAPRHEPRLARIVVLPGVLLAGVCRFIAHCRPRVAAACGNCRAGGLYRVGVSPR